MNMWYVYFYRDPTNNSVFYIGKGKGNRCKDHLYRASTWDKQGRPSKCGSLNLHLIRKILKIRESGNEPIVEIIENFENEQDAYDREIYEIANRKESGLCNITSGGEGYRVEEEKRKIIGENHSKWMNSEEGLAWRKMMSESRKGIGNPNFGKKEEETHKIQRMKNFLAKPRWNKGLKGDPRAKGPAGCVPWNAKKCRAKSVLTEQIIEAESKVKLVQKMKDLKIEISLSSVTRSIAQNRPISGWRFEYYDCESKQS